MDAAIYLRISQDRDGTMLGVDRQREDCLALCERKGWSVAEVFVDDDVSAYGRRKARPGYRALLEAVRDGRVGAIVAWHPDRLHRSPVDLEDFIALVEATGAQVATAQAGDVDLSTATGRMTARVVGAVARHESEHKAERIRRQRAQAAQAGEYHGGRRPFGYQRGGMLIDEREAEIARDVAARVIAGEAMRAIADDLNARGSRSPSGALWRITTLKSMVTGPRLAGLRVYRGEVVGEAAWPAILDRDTYERVRSVLGDPRRRQRGRPPAYLLSGLLRCWSCGGTMHASRRPKGSRRYVCNPKPGDVGRPPNGDVCGRTAIAAEPLEALIEQAVLHRITSPAVRKAMRPTKKRGEADHARALQECEARLEDLAAMFGAGDLSRREWLAARATVEKRRDSAQRALAREQGSGAVAPLRGLDPAAAWAALDTARRRAALRALVDHIVIRSANGQNVFDPDRVDVVWKA